MSVCVFFADSNSLGSKLVKLFTGGKWSHCGFYDPQTDTVIDSLYSAGGVTEYPFTQLVKHFPKVVVFKFDEFNEACLQLARAELGKPYDWSAMFSWFSDRHWMRDDKWYCSELVSSSLLDDPSFLIADDARFAQLVMLNRVSPQNLYDFLPTHRAKKI